MLENWEIPNISLKHSRSSLTTDAAKTLAQAFVGGQLDYCNSLLYGVSEELLRRLQSVQNAAARFITGTRKYDHITPVLRSLYWLPVRQRIIFKIATLMYRCLNGLAPSYLAADCTVVYAIPGRRQLRSATSGQLYIPRTRTVTFGPRSFKVCGPTIWNDLPARMKDPSLSFDSFRKLLKTFLFDKWLLHERICGYCINLRGEMFIIIIIIIIISYFNFLPCKLHSKFDGGGKISSLYIRKSEYFKNVQHLLLG